MSQDDAMEVSAVSEEEEKLTVVDTEKIFTLGLYSTRLVGYIGHRIAAFDAKLRVDVDPMVPFYPRLENLFPGTVREADGLEIHRVDAVGEITVIQILELHEIGLDELRTNKKISTKVTKELKEKKDGSKKRVAVDVDYTEEIGEALLLQITENVEITLSGPRSTNLVFRRQGLHVQLIAVIIGDYGLLIN